MPCHSFIVPLRLGSLFALLSCVVSQLPSSFFPYTTLFRSLVSLLRGAFVFRSSSVFLVCDWQLQSINHLRMFHRSALSQRNCLNLSLLFASDSCLQSASTP